LEESCSCCGLNGLLNLEVDELGSAGGPVGGGTTKAQVSCDEVDAESGVVQRDVEIEPKGSCSLSIKFEFLIFGVSAEDCFGFSEQPVGNVRNGCLDFVSCGGAIRGCLCLCSCKEEGSNECSHSDLNSFKL